MISIWCFGFSLPAFSNSKMMLLLLPFIKNAYSNVCHQIEFKSFAFQGHEFLVCARCTGIYAGAFFATFLLLINNRKLEPKLNFFLLGAFPLLMDVVFLNLHLYQYSKWIASSTGFIFGSITIMYILGIVENSIFREKQA